MASTDGFKPIPMSFERRRFLAATAALTGIGMASGALAQATALIGSTPAQLLPPGPLRRVVIVGGGWAGLSAARHLSVLAPELEVVLLEKNPQFWSLPLSNQWVTGLNRLSAPNGSDSLPTYDYRMAARIFGYTFIQAEVTDIDRERRRVVTAAGVLGYDWLILAVGIRQDYSAWFAADRQAIEHTERAYPAANMAGVELAALRRKLESFGGGEFLMTIPPLPYRCPPAPYERALMIAQRFKALRLKARLTVVDPNPIASVFSRTLVEQYADQATYLAQSRVIALDPFKRTLRTGFDELHFDDAIIMAPQQAGDLVWRAGLIGKDGAGQATGWAAQQALSFQAVDDEHIYLVGDLAGKVSLLFGHYPKTGHMASRQGKIVAQLIAARAQERDVQPELPESVCYVHAKLEPAEMQRIDAHYRQRGDGLLMQTLKQTLDPNPRDEQQQWAHGMYAELFGVPG